MTNPKRPETMHPPRPLHHPALRLGPVPLPRQQPDVRPFQGGGQMAVLGLGVPERRAFRQPQLRTTSTSFPLLAGQPVPQGVDQVIVGRVGSSGRLTAKADG